MAVSPNFTVLGRPAAGGDQPVFGYLPGVL